MEIILDTNFLITAVKNKIQLFEALEDFQGNVLIPTQVISELKILKEDPKLKTIEKNSVNLALQLIKIKKIKKIDFQGKDADAGFVRYCKNHDTTIATLDRILKSKIKTVNKNTKFLTIKEKKRIALQ